MGKRKKVPFVFEFEYNIAGTNDVIFDTDYVYTSRKCNGQTVNYQDHIVITKRKIEINGNRSKKDSLLECLKKTNNPIYQQLFRAVIFAYVTQGKAFQKGICQLDVDGISYKEDEYGEIQDLCNKNLDNYMTLPVDVAKKIFDNTQWSKAFLVSLSEYVFVYNMEIPDLEVQLFELWKAFNSVYTYYYSTVNTSGGRGSEHKQLTEINNFIKNNLKGTELSVKDSVYYADKALDFEIKKMLLTKKTSGKTESNKLRHVKECITNCNDKSLLDIYMKIIDGDPHKFNFPVSDKQEIEMHYASIVENSDVDLLCFIVIEYGYFIRCKHFHGEKGTPAFLVKNNPELEEIKVIVEILRKLLIDLYIIINDN